LLRGRSDYEAEVAQLYYLNCERRGTCCWL
jgi:hypothetical protein